MSHGYALAPMENGDANMGDRSAMREHAQRNANAGISDAMPGSWKFILPVFFAAAALSATLQTIGITVGASQTSIVLQTMIVAAVTWIAGWRTAVTLVGGWMLCLGAAITFLNRDGWHQRPIPGDLLLTGIAWYAAILLIAHQRRRFRKYQHAAQYDELTGTVAAGPFLRQLQSQCRLASRAGESLGLIILDCDRFKLVNDEFGHPVGDDLLRDFGRRIRETIRVYDSVGRLGGDEFAILLPKADRTACRAVVRRLRQRLKRSSECNPDHSPPSFCAGAVVANGNAINADDVRYQADHQLLLCKRLGGNQFRQTVLHVRSTVLPTSTNHQSRR